MNFIRDYSDVAKVISNLPLTRGQRFRGFAPLFRLTAFLTPLERGLFGLPPIFTPAVGRADFPAVDLLRFPPFPTAFIASSRPLAIAPVITPFVFTIVRTMN